VNEKNWYIGGFGIPKPHKLDQLEWLGIICVGGWKNYRDGQKNEKFRYKAIIFVMGFLVMLPMMAVMWPLFLGGFIENWLRDRHWRQLNGNHA
jgi:hypothetical protein